MLPEQRWLYRAQVLRVIDGDTLVITLDLGFNLSASAHLRLLGVNAPELHGATAGAGLQAKRFAETWVMNAGSTEQGWPFVLETHKLDELDSFGRYLATCWRVNDGSCLNEELLASGNAVVFK
jgi:micrococcal nuclease